MRLTTFQKALLFFLPILLAAAPYSSTTLSEVELIKKKTTDGQVMEMEQIIEGKISLYKFDRKSQAIPVQASYAPYSQYFDYYIGLENSFLVQKLGHENYQVILHRVLGRVSKWRHQYDIEKIQYEEVGRLIQEFNQEFK